MKKEEQKRIQWSEKNVKDLLIILNNCMKSYENNIERRMKFSERVEWDSIKKEPVIYRKRRKYK